MIPNGINVMRCYSLKMRSEKNRVLCEQPEHKVACAIVLLKEQLKAGMQLIESVIQEARRRPGGLHLPKKIYSLHENPYGVHL